MKRSTFVTLTLLLVLSVIIPATLVYANSQKTSDTSTASVGQLVQKYASANSGKKIRILIVPGHEPGFGGAEYQNTYEREITVSIADELAAYLRTNPRYEVLISRSNTNWNDALSTYFQQHWSDIQTFVTEHKLAFTKSIDSGRTQQRAESDQVTHAIAPDDVALRLYGINEWTNDTDVDLVVHIHINDSPDHTENDPSQNSGFAVYVPDSQYGNAATSRPLGEAIASRLSILISTSTLPVENKGVVEDQQLIALGAYDTLSVPSALIEYSYITEPQILHPEVRALVTKDYAYETYLGIQDFFKDPVLPSYPTASLPFMFVSTTNPVGSASPTTYVLQIALHLLGFYPTLPSTIPPTVRLMAPSLTTCPINGIMGPCTRDGLEAFQRAKGLRITGTLDEDTARSLTTLFSDQPVIQTGSSAEMCKVSAKTVGLGMKDTKTDASIAHLQRLLSLEPGIYPSKQVTGTFGPATLAAVQKFQISQGLAKKGGAGYGIVGPKTRAALRTAHC
jgi:N-acetylmuramoyl-L-alanine amidase/peptidoglycan hydrolase-like protein with peptidoglycan-binding domain